jgi:hypothetical protein
MKTIGHKITPTVILKESELPKIFQFTSDIPKLASNEKILTPMNSAMMALAIKKLPNTRKRMVLLLSFI